MTKILKAQKGLRLVPNNRPKKPIMHRSDQVTYSSPHYAELYKAGKLGRYNSEKDEFTMAELPGVDVSGKKMSALEKYDYDTEQEAIKMRAKRESERKIAGQNPLNNFLSKTKDGDYTLSGSVMNPNNWTKKNWSEVGAGLESQFRLNDAPNPFDDYLNPLAMVGSMASSLGQAPQQAKESNSNIPYLAAFGVPVATGLLGGLGAKTTGQFINNMSNPLAGTGVDNFVTSHGKSIVNNVKALREGIADVEKLKRLQNNTYGQRVLTDPSLDPKLKDVREIAKLGSELSNSSNLIGKSIPKAEKTYERLLNKAIALEKEGLVNPNAFYDLTRAGEEISTIKGQLAGDSDIQFINEGLQELDLPILNEKAIEYIKQYPVLSSYAQNPDILNDIEKFTDFTTALNENPESILKDMMGPGKNTEFRPGDYSVGKDLDTLFPYKPKLYTYDNQNLFKSRIDEPISVPGNDPRFHSLAGYDRLKTKLLNKYTDARIGTNRSIIGELPDHLHGEQLMGSLFAGTDDTLTKLKKATSYADSKPDGAFIGAGSLSSDSYPLSLDFMHRELKKPGNNAQLRFSNYSSSNGLGFVDNLVPNKNILNSELTRKIQAIEKTIGKELPKPFVENGSVQLPKFVLTKGNTNTLIDEQLANKKASELFNRNRGIKLQPKPESSAATASAATPTFRSRPDNARNVTIEGRQYTQSPTGSWYDVTDSAPRPVAPPPGRDNVIRDDAYYGIHADDLDIDTSGPDPNDFIINPNRRVSLPNNINYGNIVNADGLYYHVVDGERTLLDPTALNNHMLQLRNQRRRVRISNNDIPPPPPPNNDQVYKKGGLIKRKI